MATDRQKEIAEAVQKHGSHRKAAEALGVCHGTVDRAMAQLKVDPAWREAGERLGFDPTARGGWWKTPPRDGEPGASVYYPTPKRNEADLEEELRGRLDGFAADLPRYDPIPPPTYAPTALANVLVVADAHLGMLAWWREGGADWDIKLAERVIFDAVQNLISRAPQADILYLVFLGDWRHFERFDPVTNRAGHVLAADSRIRKVNEVAVRLKRRIIDYCLVKCLRVVLIDAEGNHDETSFSIDLAWLKVSYEFEKRLTLVDDDALPYHACQHGETMLMFHHGHIRSPKKPADRATLALYFADVFPDIWTSTRYRYCHTGHLHHLWNGQDGSTPVIWEQHPTLAAADSYPARHAMRSKRAMSLITYHESFGERGRQWVTPDELLAEISVQKPV